MSPKDATARFLLRLPRALHTRLQRAAAAQALSLNEYCVQRLSAEGRGVGDPGPARAVVQRADEVSGGALVGVLLYGSWARGSAGPGSDVDALIVFEAATPLTRALYRDWDAAPVTWEGRPVDPHFVHLPPDGPASGLWGEAAVDGVVLFESGLRLSAVLGRVRRDIVAGRLVRRVAHGQPYWVAA